MDDFNPEAVDDYWGSQIYWADEAYQVRGSQDDYDAVMESVDPEAQQWADKNPWFMREGYEEMTSLAYGKHASLEIGRASCRERV